MERVNIISHSGGRKILIVTVLLVVVAFLVMCSRTDSKRIDVSPDLLECGSFTFTVWSADQIVIRMEPGQSPLPRGKLLALVCIGRNGKELWLTGAQTDAVAGALEKNGYWESTVVDTNYAVKPLQVRQVRAELRSLPY